jgi:hypothetical protein
VSPVKYEMGFYIPEDTILHSHCRGNPKSYIVNLNFILHFSGRIKLVGFSPHLTLWENDNVNIEKD